MKKKQAGAYRCCWVLGIDNGLILSTRALETSRVGWDSSREKGCPLKGTDPSVRRLRTHHTGLGV